MMMMMIFIAQWIGSTSAITMNKDQAAYPSSIDINEVMSHLNALQAIAIAENGNRAVKTRGFNRSVDYIFDYLTSNTNLRVSKRYFPMRNYQLLSNPTFSSTINGIIKTYRYSATLSQAEFTHVQYSTSISGTANLQVTAIPNLGCSDGDWLSARPPPSGAVVIIKRGDCTFEEKAALATKYKVAALLIYNDGTASDRLQPLTISLGLYNRVPALSLSYNVGQSLVTAINDPSRIVTLRLTISTDTAVYPIGNVCADTPTGDATQTILIGSHSDSVPAGPGINDNGMRKRLVI